MWDRNFLQLLILSLFEQECTAFGSTSDNRAMAGDANAINVCYDFLISTLSKENLETLRLDVLQPTEDYFAVYNGAVIEAANPYFVFVQQIGLSSVLTDNYSPKGKPCLVPLYFLIFSYAAAMSAARLILPFVFREYGQRTSV